MPPNIFFEGSALDKQVHARFALEIDKIADAAGIQREYITTPLSETCNDDEVEWVRRYKKHAAEDIFGLCLTGDAVAMSAHMSAIAGALLRNFIDAKVVTLHTLADPDQRPDLSDVSTLLVPNFFLTSASGGSLATWKVAEVYDLLLGRVMRKQQTVLYVENITALANEYGVAMMRLINQRYETIKVV